jgi:hypothetical protein
MPKMIGVSPLQKFNLGYQFGDKRRMGNPAPSTSSIQAHQVLAYFAGRKKRSNL